MKIKSAAVFNLEKQNKPAVDRRNPKLLDASRLYEEQFLREMVREMRKTINDSDLIHVGMAEKIFREQLDDKYVKIWTDDGGIGLADLIYKQIMEQYGPQTEAANKSFTPLRMKGHATGASLQLRNPWPGQVINRGHLEDGQIFTKIAHDSGLNSELIYRGTFAPVDRRIGANQTIGWLDPAARGFSWNLLPNSSQYDTI